VSYFSQFPEVKIKTYADRVSIKITGPAYDIGHLFNTTIESNNTSNYFVNSAPELPASFVPYVSEVAGLSNTKLSFHFNLADKLEVPVESRPVRVDGGYPSPLNNNGTQNIYGSDLQVAYDEQSLLNITYPINEVIATILWAGTNSSGEQVGPFDPSDIYSYFNATLPSYEPHPEVFGVPLNGAAKPGISASYDVTGANQENTLDLEMVGSTAPGARIYNVYGSNATTESLDSALAFILNPNSSYPALNNVSVITNSWGGTDSNNTVWYQYLEEAQVRGISVLASSGDSGDNNQSSKYVGSTVEFPSAMAYNNFGVTAVGGDTIILADNLHILNETAWYISSADSSDGGPAGSTGGISSIFKEPVWQLSTEANRVINGKGRGVPDISAIANNTIVYITENGKNYYGNHTYYTFGGTSVASPVEAGIVAEIDAVLNHYNQPNLGYLNPIIYSLANKQIEPMNNTLHTGYIPTGNYNSTLPMLPFYNVMFGRNHVYNATYGYNLVTGWGSIDAYNFSMYIFNINRNSSFNDLKGVQDILNLSGLNVTSYLYNSTTSEYSTVNRYYNASIQQNLFLANQFGAPIYWIQNVIYINRSQPSGWAVNYTGWVVYPFYGQYPRQTVYEYYFPLGKTISIPHTFNVRTWITNLSDTMQQTVNFEVNLHVISLPVPGAAYIIDAYNYSYAWQGHTYYNGPFPNNRYTGGLNPQFGLVGGPSGGLGVFAKPTSGCISAYIEPIAMNSYIPAVTSAFNESIDETGEAAEFLSFTGVNENNWTISINKTSSSQGIVDYPSSGYCVTFVESGLPSGTTWYVNLTNGMKSGPIKGSSYTFSLTNGSYRYAVATLNHTYRPETSLGKFTVSGSSLSESVTFTKAIYFAKFSQSGLPSGRWYVNITGMPSAYNPASEPIVIGLTNGTYFYSVSTTNSEYISSGGNFTIDGKNITINVKFSIVRYAVTFTESGLPSGRWYVNLTESNGTHYDSGSITGSSYTIQLSNGTYSYTIATMDKTYSPSPSLGTITVSGSSLSESVVFSKVTYTVTFTESGLPSGTTWSVTFNGTTESSTTDTITFSVPNGTYSYSIGSVSGYTISQLTGSVTINGDNAPLNITFSHTSSPPEKKSSSTSGISSFELYAMIGAVVSVVVIGSVTALIMRKK